MQYAELILDDVPELSGEAAAQLLDFLYALTTALENRYFAQIREHRQPNPPAQYDLFKAHPDPIAFHDPAADF
jgi:hypothetical protein